MPGRRGAVTEASTGTHRKPTSSQQSSNATPVNIGGYAEGIIRDKFIAVPNKLLNDVVVPMLAK
jgi:hypothetical protein